MKDEGGRMKDEVMPECGERGYVVIPAVVGGNPKVNRHDPSIVKWMPDNGIRA